MKKLFTSKIFVSCLFLLFFVFSAIWYVFDFPKCSFFNNLAVNFTLPITTTVLGGYILFILTGLQNRFTESEKRELLNDAIESYKSNQYPKARDLLSRLANDGYAEAQNYLGRVYENYDNHAENPFTDSEAAIEWYEKAANQGHAYAQHNLGRMYEEVKEDIKLAHKWYFESARQGYVFAKLKLGWLYYKQGWFASKEDVKLYAIKSYMWFIIVKNKHGKDTQATLNKLKKNYQMTDSDIQQAEAMACACIDSDYNAPDCSELL